MDKVLAILIGWPFAFLMLRYRRQIKEIVGDVGFAEKIFGMGGTNTFIVLLGIVIFILCLMYALGTLQSIIDSSLGPLFGK